MIFRHRLSRFASVYVIIRKRRVSSRLSTILEVFPEPATAKITVLSIPQPAESTWVRQDRRTIFEEKKGNNGLILEHIVFNTQRPSPQTKFSVTYSLVVLVHTHFEGVP